MIEQRRDRTGQQLGDYRLERLLVRHGFADTYLGEHILHHKQVVLRLFHVTLRDEDSQDFIKEVQVLAQLDHPHILRIIDVVVEDGIPMIVIDATSHETLRVRHPRGVRLELATIIPYLEHLASALRYLHDQNLIHHNIQPESMVIGTEEKVVLSHFGFTFLAHHTILVETPALEEAVVEAVSYMAPEQIRGEASSASDQYALAVVVYEWLCGRLPFEGSPLEIIEQHLSANPPPLRELVPNLDPAIEQAVLKAMAKDPEQRFDSAEDFVQALKQAAQFVGSDNRRAR